MITKEWLELAEAAQLVGVHQSTLRRWADAGKVAHIRTLSGRRRFSRSALDQVRLEMERSGKGQPAQRFETHSLDLARQRKNDLSTHQMKWFALLNEEHRMLFRYSGQRLLGLMMQFISRGDSGEKFLSEGRNVARDYGQICYRAGLSIAQTAEAFLYFRRSILESVQATSGLGGPDDQDSQRVFLRTIDFFDALLVATMDSYANINLSIDMKGAAAFQGDAVTMPRIT
ncbi:MAG: helix-turn-helix domain-containing protein [Chloroflexi bacterium]|nr:MAG: helix-turn-helix domain-containing protein [Chloroflexota bacterium]